MAEQLYFSRDSKLYLELDSTVWEIPILDGFSFSQSTNQTEISLSEMQGSDGLSRRGNRLFTDSLAPAEWSFSTYVRPYETNSEHGAVEEALWAVMAGADKYKAANAGGGMVKGAGGSNTTVVVTGGGTISGATAGTYTINDEDSGITGTAPSGAVGWEIDIVMTTTGVTSVTVISGGSGFSVNDTLIIPASLVGGGDKGVTVTVAAVTTTGASFYRGSQADENSTFGPAVVEPSGTSSIINFGQSNRSTLGTCNLYFVMETSTANPMVYKLSNAAVNEASIDFEVDGIATINWSGFAKTITDMQSGGDVYSIANVGGAFATTNSHREAVTDAIADTVNTTDPAVGDVILNSNDDMAFYIVTDATSSSEAAVKAIDTAVDNTSTFIRNRLTQLLVEDKDADTTAFPSTNYNLTLTGGNITISNNISYLVPEELGAVNVPIEHVTGGRTASGSFTCYLTLDDSSGNNGTSVELFNDMTNSATGGGLSKVVNNFEVVFQIGGSVGTPRLNVTMPKVHINVPSHSIEDVISVETSFGAYTDDFNVANEIQLEYVGPAI